jgi:dinuclear metal center YbgI/SA1388 family protein
MDVTKVVKVLEAYFPLSLQEGWDNSGLQISPEDSSIKGVLLSLDIGLDTIDEAISNGCNLIIAHHPLLFSKTKKLYNNFYPYNVVHKAIKNGIGIYAFHTNLDIAKDGLNDYLCRLLELSNIEIIEDHLPLRIGELPSKMDLENAIVYIKNKLNAECIKFTKGNDKQIEKIAVCSGSCADMIYEIQDKDFDLFLTGDLKHHTAYFAKYSNINICDATHFHTEKYAKFVMEGVLKKKFNSLKIITSKTDFIPWSYK